MRTSGPEMSRRRFLKFGGAAVLGTAGVGAVAAETLVGMAGAASTDMPPADVMPPGAAMCSDPSTPTGLEQGGSKPGDMATSGPENPTQLTPEMALMQAEQQYAIAVMGYYAGKSEEVRAGYAGATASIRTSSPEVVDDGSTVTKNWQYGLGETGTMTVSETYKDGKLLSSVFTLGETRVDLRIVDTGSGQELWIPHTSYAPNYVMTTIDNPGTPESTTPNTSTTIPSAAGNTSGYNQPGPNSYPGASTSLGGLSAGQQAMADVSGALTLFKRATQ